jgi:hypothetical protein
VTPKTDWPYDADQHDPLTAMRIPVTSAYPEWRYIATFDGESEARPTDAEAAMLASFIEQYKVYFFGADGWYKRKLEEKPFDCDAVTKIFHKWGAGDWSYRVVTWESGPLWVPVQPRLRGGQYDYKGLGAHTLEQAMDLTHHLGTKYPDTAWVQWKSDHPDVFGATA